MTLADHSLIQTLSWDDFLAQWEWRQGEHTTLIGPTGRGKTYLTRAILPRRDYIVFVGTKPHDDAYDALEAEGFKRTTQFRPDINQQILNPIKRKSAAEDRRMARDEIGAMLDDLYVQGGWTVVLDELRFVTDTLGLKDKVELLWLQGRSLGITVVAGAQRPRHVPLAAYSQAQHLFMWRTRDRNDVRRLADFSGDFNHRDLLAFASDLPDHACLYANADGRLVRTGVGMTVRR